MAFEEALAALGARVDRARVRSRSSAIAAVRTWRWWTCSSARTAGRRGLPLVRTPAAARPRRPARRRRCRRHQGLTAAERDEERRMKRESRRGRADPARARQGAARRRRDCRSCRRRSSALPANGRRPGGRCTRRIRRSRSCGRSPPRWASRRAAVARPGCQHRARVVRRVRGAHVGLRGRARRGVGRAGARAGGDDRDEGRRPRQDRRRVRPRGRGRDEGRGGAVAGPAAPVARSGAGHPRGQDARGDRARRVPLERAVRGAAVANPAATWSKTPPCRTGCR